MWELKCVKLKMQYVAVFIALSCLTSYFSFITWLQFRRPISPFASIRDQSKKNITNSSWLSFENLPFLINPHNVCGECKTGFLLLVLVSSALGNIQKRTAIRKTWGKTTECVKTLYVIGTSNNDTVTRTIQNESENYHDIVQGDFIDTYRNLTYKHVMLLNWANKYCQQTKYVVKTDDDIAVNVDLLYDNLKKDHWGPKGLIACYIRASVPVERNNSKWTVTSKEYREDKYPDYCAGPFIIYSTDVVKRLVEESNKVRYFWIDDIFVTGIVAKRIGIKHVNINNWYRCENNSLLSNNSKSAKPFLFGPFHKVPELT